MFAATVRPARATVYYVSASGAADSSGLSDAEAWSYETLNRAKLAAGDQVLFKRGDTFHGALAAQSGSADKPISYGAYSTGRNPCISGLAVVDAWEHVSGNIYSAQLSQKPSIVNLVTLDERVVAMGRYPNQGYLTYVSHSGNTSIAGPAIAHIPFDATGAEAVIRKYRWILDRHAVLAHSGDLLRLDTRSRDGGSLAYQPVNGNGFFLQNHRSTLDLCGEWFYDALSHRLYMCLSGPAARVKVSVVDRLVHLPSMSNICFADMDFEGSNIHGISMHAARNISFIRCRFSKHGQTAIYGDRATDITIDSGTIENCLNNGIWIESGGSNVRVDGMAFDDIGSVAGAGRSGDGAQVGIAISGTGTTIRNCTLRQIGYNAIQFNGSDAVIEQNLVDRFCLVKDDGAGIYTFAGHGAKVANRIVRRNIVLNAVGALGGAESYDYESYGKAAGIYLDGESNQTIVANNVIAHGPWAGVFVNNNSGNRIDGNLIFDHSAGVLFVESQAGAIRNTFVTDNILVARTSDQKTLCVRLHAADDVHLLGPFDRNVYAGPVDNARRFIIDRQYAGGGGVDAMTFDQWKTASRLDQCSIDRAVVPHDESLLRFEVNFTGSTRAVELPGKWKDIRGMDCPPSGTVAPYGANIFLQIPEAKVSH